MKGRAYQLIQQLMMGIHVCPCSMHVPSRNTQGASMHLCRALSSFATYICLSVCLAATYNICVQGLSVCMHGCLSTFLLSLSPSLGRGMGCDSICVSHQCPVNCSCKPVRSELPDCSAQLPSEGVCPFV